MLDNRVLRITSDSKTKEEAGQLKKKCVMCSSNISTLHKIFSG
jgi:hypothetical protein